MGSYLIIEKDSSSIDTIKSVLNDFQNFNCIGICDDYDDAMNIILKKSPCLVFFNIDGIIANHFQFMNEIHQFQERMITFIAITSSMKKAYLAMKNGFYDSLLKPLNELEIRKTILKFQKKNRVELKNTICLRSYKDYRYLSTNEILFLKADNNATDFYMKDGNSVSAFKTLKIFEKLLPDNFLRIHKSYIINSDYVSRINYGKLVCTVKKNSYNIPFTKTYINNVETMNRVLTESSFLSLN